MAAYQIFTDATSDLNSAMLTGIPPVEIIPMNVTIGGCTYTYGLHGDISVQEFYQMQKAGNFATTSQINPNTYLGILNPACEMERTSCIDALHRECPAPFNRHSSA